MCALWPVASKFDMPGCDQEEMTKSSGMVSVCFHGFYSVGIVNEILLRTISWFYFIYSYVQKSSLLVISHIILVISVLLEKTEVNCFHLLSQGIFVSVPRYVNV